MKARFMTVEFPVLSNYIVHVEVTSNLKRSMMRYPPAAAAVKHFEDRDESLGEAITIHMNEDDGFSFIFLPYNVSTGTIAHESWHVIKHMMDHCDIKLDSETVAYHLGYLVNEIFKFVRRKR